MSHTKRITYGAKDFGRGRAISAAVQFVKSAGTPAGSKETQLVLLKDASAPTGARNNRVGRLELKHA